MQVLAQQTSLDPNLTGADIKTAFQKSGLFLEASLATGAMPSAASAPSAGSAPGAGVPDLKAALIVLRQALQTALGGGTSAAHLPHADAVATSAPMAADDLDLQEILLPQARLPVADDLGVNQNAAAGSVHGHVRRRPDRCDHAQHLAGERAGNRQPRACARDAEGCVTARK